MDVVVVGGGSAGLGAAIGAARAGARTLLVEKSERLGGMASLALVHTICGLYEPPRGEGAVWANPGFPREFASRLLAEGGAGPAVRLGRVDVLPIDPEAFGNLAVEMASAEDQLEVMMNSEVTAIGEAENRITGVRVETDRGKIAIEARAIIDCSGDAIIAKMGGFEAEIVSAGRLQRPAWIVGIRNVNGNCFDADARLVLAHTIAKGVSAGQLPAEATGTAFRRSIRDGEAFVTVDLAAGGDTWNPDDIGMIADLERLGDSTAMAVVEFLRKRIPGWENAEIFRKPARAGIRESRRATGVVRLTGDHLSQGTQFPDAVARAGWPMELRETASGPKWRFLEQAADIPLRALRHRDVENLWFAGRCISVDHDAQASVRVMGTCLATGEAAGIAAAVSPDGEDWVELARRVAEIRDEIARRC